MYSYDCIMDGVKYSVFFFSTFIGHFHPFTPYDPLDISEAYTRGEKTYYLAWYVGDEKTPRLRYLEKYWMVFVDMPAPQSRRSVPGRYYFAVEQTPAGYRVKDEIDALATTKLDVFYTYLVGNNGEVKESNVIKKSLFSKYSYTYNQRGALVDKKIEAFDIPEEDRDRD